MSSEKTRDPFFPELTRTAANASFGSVTNAREGSAGPTTVPKDPLSFPFRPSGEFGSAGPSGLRKGVGKQMEGSRGRVLAKRREEQVDEDAHHDPGVVGEPLPKVRVPAERQRQDEADQEAYDEHDACDDVSTWADPLGLHEPQNKGPGR
jgi:hypothetical protein